MYFFLNIYTHTHTHTHTHTMQKKMQREAILTRSFAYFWLRESRNNTQFLLLLPMLILSPSLRCAMSTTPRSHSLTHSHSHTCTLSLFQISLSIPDFAIHFFKKEEGRGRECVWGSSHSPLLTLTLGAFWYRQAILMAPSSFPSLSFEAVVGVLSSTFCKEAVGICKQWSMVFVEEM